MALLSAEILRLRSRFIAYVQAPNFCTSLVKMPNKVEYARAEAKIRASPWNTLAVSTDFSASVSARFCAYGKQSHEIGPGSIGTYMYIVRNLTQGLSRSMTRNYSNKFGK